MSRRKITAGSTSQTVPVFVQDTSSTTGGGLGSLVFNTSGLAAKYRREGQSSWTTITLATATAGTWTSGGFVTDGGPVTGTYEFGIPDAVLAGGAKWAEVAIYGAANMLPVLLEFELDTLNYQASGGKVPATVAAADVSGNLPADLQTIKTQTVTCAAGVTVPALLASTTNITAGTITTATNLTNDPAGVTTLLSRVTASRAGYFDNLNVGGAVASSAEITALNQSASRRVVLVTVPQYERPESGSTVYTVEARTYDGDGAATNADSTPTLTATGQTTGSLAANLGSATNPATGVYRWTYSVAAAATVEPVRFDMSAVVASSTFTMSAYTQVVDLVAATWTTTDASHLTALYNVRPAFAPTVDVNGVVDANAVMVGPSGGGTAQTAGDLATLITTVRDRLGTPVGNTFGDDSAGILSALTTIGSDLLAAPTNVWTAVSPRTLTGGDNIQLAKGVGVVGFNDPTAAAVAAAVRDVSNANPAAASLGAGVKAGSDRMPGSGTLAVAGDAMTLTGPERAAVAAALLDLADGVEVGVTVRKAFRAVAAALVGDATGAGTSAEAYRAAGNPGTTRVTPNADADGNRTGVVLNL